LNVGSWNKPLKRADGAVGWSSKKTHCGSRSLAVNNSAISAASGRGAPTSVSCENLPKFRQKVDLPNNPRVGSNQCGGCDVRAELAPEIWEVDNVNEC